MRDADVVINLVGILYERGRQRFEAVQAFGAEPVALGRGKYGARLIQVSAIGADEHSPSRYARTKAEGEKAVLAGHARRHHPAAVDRVRPGGRLLQQVRRDGALVPALPLIGGGADPIPAGVRRRRRRGRRPRGRRRDHGRHDL